MNLKNNHIFVFYSILYISLLFGFFLNEDLTLGTKIDHETHLKIINILGQDFINVLLNFDKLGLSSAHSPFFYSVYLIIKKISFDNELILRLINLHISLFIPYIFYLILITKDKIINNNLIKLLPGIFFISPYFRSGSFWIGSENISLIFLFSSFYVYLLFEKQKNKKFNLIILNIIFLSLAAYLRPIYSLFSVFFLISLFNDLIKIKRIFHYILLNLIIALPAFYYIFILKVNFFYIHIGEQPITISRFINQFSIVTSVLLFYSTPIIIFNFKNLIKSFFKTDNLIFCIIFTSILITFFNYNFNYGGGIFYKISSIFFSNNYLFYLFAVLGLIFFKIIIFDKFQFNKNLNDFILFFTLIFLEIDRTIFHETFDILIYPIFYILFKNFYFSEFLIKFNKKKLFFLYFFSLFFLLITLIKITLL